VNKSLCSRPAKARARDSRPTRLGLELALAITPSLVGLGLGLLDLAY